VNGSCDRAVDCKRDCCCVCASTDQTSRSGRGTRCAAAAAAAAAVVTTAGRKRAPRRLGRKGEPGKRRKEELRTKGSMSEGQSEGGKKHGEFV